MTHLSPTLREETHWDGEKLCVHYGPSLSVPKRTSLRPDKPVHKLSSQYDLPSFIQLPVFSSSVPFLLFSTPPNSTITSHYPFKKYLVHSYGRLGFVVAVVLFGRVSHCSPGRPRIHRDSPASASGKVF